MDEYRTRVNIFSSLIEKDIVIIKIENNLPFVQRYLVGNLLCSI
jgi:hypothetical protein